MTTLLTIGALVYFSGMPEWAKISLCVMMVAEFLYEMNEASDRNYRRQLGL